MVQSVKSSSMNYDSWVNSLNQRGIKTTSLGKNEANFQDYTNALSESLKQEIVSSFDNEADYALQAKLASLYGGKSVKQSGDIVSAAKAAGINVKVEYVKTSYIVDNKLGGSHMNNKSATQGSIAVYTFSDGKGGEIKIADANGNGALETEEIFMNEILSDVVSDIKPGSSGSSSGISATQTAMTDNTAKLKEMWENQKTEQENRLKEQLEEFKKYDPNAKLSSESSSTPSKLQELAISKIKDSYPDISDEEANEYANAAISKAQNAGISISKAIEIILGSGETEVEEEKQVEEA